jgi:hypothetical protein
MLSSNLSLATCDVRSNKNFKILPDGLLDDRSMEINPFDEMYHLFKFVAIFRRKMYVCMQ